MSEAMVTITKKEYQGLIEDSNFLLALQDAGVDNWDGYSYAQDGINNMRFEVWFGEFQSIANENNLPIGDKESYRDYFDDDFLPKEAVLEEKQSA